MSRFCFWFLAVFPLTAGFGSPYDLTVSSEAYLGYRHDDADWNIAGGEDGANICSEVSWRKLQMFQVGGNLKVHGLGSLTVRAKGDYAWICDGEVQDSDFNGYDKAKEFSRSISNAGDGAAYDVSIGLGMQLFRMCGVTLSPVGGYGYMRQNLHMFDGKQIFHDDYPEAKGLRLMGLDSSYKNCWKGPFAGADLIMCCGNISLAADWEYYWIHFSGEGDWNLRKDILSHFHDKANGYGNHIEVRVYYGVFCGVSFGLGADYWRFCAKDGTTEHKALVDLENQNGEYVGSVPVWIKGGFNEVNWESWRINATLSLCF